MPHRSSLTPLTGFVGLLAGYRSRPTRKRTAGDFHHRNR